MSFRVVHLQPIFRVDDRGTLRISGTAGADTLLVGGRNGNVRVKLNGHETTITRSVHRAVIYGGGGDDFINAGSAGGTDVESLQPYLVSFGSAQFPIYVDGGSGDDTIGGGSGRWGYSVTGFDESTARGDTLFGGEGDDTINSHFNPDSPKSYVDGGPGDDTLANGTVMHGGSGNDVATFSDYWARPIFTSGLETLIDAHDDSKDDRIVPSSEYVSTLTTRNGKLVLSYLAAGKEVHRLGAPYLRADGRIGATVTFDYPTNATRGPNERQFLTLSDRYTTRAKEKGIVLTFAGPAAGKPKEWEILLPARD